MEIQQTLERNNSLLEKVLIELSSIKMELAKKERDECGTDEAMIILGVSNERYLTYYFRLQLLNRRKGGVSYLYSKKECAELAAKFKDGTLKIPSLKQMYAKS